MRETTIIAPILLALFCLLAVVWLQKRELAACYNPTATEDDT